MLHQENLTQSILQKGFDSMLKTCQAKPIGSSMKEMQRQLSKRKEMSKHFLAQMEKGKISRSRRKQDTPKNKDNGFIEIDKFLVEDHDVDTQVAQNLEKVEEEKASQSHKASSNHLVSRVELSFKHQTGSSTLPPINKRHLDFEPVYEDHETENNE